jgi:hypothetical protein
MTATSAQSAYNANPFPEIDRPATRGLDAIPEPARPRGPTPHRFPSPRFGAYSRTRFESRVAFGGQDEGEEPEEVAASTRRFSALETTSGLPDDSREADEKQARRRLHDLRARVKAARAVVARTPGLAAVLANDWQKAARFYARFGIMETQFRNGIRSGERGVEVDTLLPFLATPQDGGPQMRNREDETLPSVRGTT